VQAMAGDFGLSYVRRSPAKTTRTYTETKMDTESRKCSERDILRTVHSTYGSHRNKIKTTKAKI